MMHSSFFSYLEPNRLQISPGMDAQGQPLLLSLASMSPILLYGPTHEALEATVLRSLLVQLITRNDTSHLQIAFSGKDTSVARFFEHHALSVPLQAMFNDFQTRPTRTRPYGGQIPHGLLVIEQIERSSYDLLQRTLMPLYSECRKHGIALLATTTAQDPPDFLLQNTVTQIIVHQESATITLRQFSAQAAQIFPTAASNTWRLAFEWRAKESELIPFIVQESHLRTLFPQSN